MATNIEVEGLDDLESQLLKLQGKVAIKVVRDALKASAKIVLKDAKSNVPVGSGALKASLGIIARKGRGTNFQTVFVAPRQKNKTALALANASRSTPIKGIFYAHIVEKGSVRSKPQPFLRPALDSNVNAV
jgi:HK97 gp10 family phage protein